LTTQINIAATSTPTTFRLCNPAKEAGGHFANHVEQSKTAMSALVLAAGHEVEF